MRVTVVKDYRTIFNVTDKNNNGETYIVRFQDNALPTIHGDSFLEIYGDGGAIRELSKSLTGLETKRSFQIDAYSIASTPIYVNEGVLYIACNSGEGLFHIHDWVAPRLTCNFNTVLDVNKQPLLISRYLGYSDGGLSVFTTEQIGVVVSKDNKGNRISGAEYRALSVRKQKKYRAFYANKEVATYFNEIAKAIVNSTHGDPYNQNKELSKIKADYIKKRFDKDIKVSE